MGIAVFVEGLKHPNPAARIEMLRVLAMVEEVEALPALRKMLPTETDAVVIEEIKRTGQVLWDAQQRGHSTDAGISVQFKLHLQKSQAEIEEEKKLASYKAQLESQMIRDKKDSTLRTTGIALAAGVLGSVAGGSSVGIAAAMSTMSNVNVDLGSGPERPQIGSEAIPPQRPSDSDITIWVKRLKELDAQKRRTALIELRNLNNPAALPHLAASYSTDPDPTVRDEARRSGKHIYYNWLYWELTQAAAQTPSNAPASTGTPAASQPPSPPTPVTTSNPQDVADILAKAEAARRARAAKKGK
ncbi:MAG TPA: HEAT repeat domain-containing protein [Aggregatilineales bacterium]|nr:HEAT repeat domain-containing protein [Aggregatilineales bacterium]